MDDGELEFSNNLFSNPNGCSMENLFDDIWNDDHACTHTHTCNPPGPDASHTHTCFHVHTKIIPAESDDKASTEDTSESTDKKTKKRPVGNREAVRKYREKKKARALSLEDEVQSLRNINQQLMKRLQGQAVLETEVARLKCLLVDIRGRIEGEIGSFPYQKMGKATNVGSNFPGAYVVNPCEMRCDDLAALNGQGSGACDFGNGQCLESPDNLAIPGNNNMLPSVNIFANRRRGGARAPSLG